MARASQWRASSDLLSVASLGTVRGTNAMSARAHQAPNGAFRNPWPNSAPPGWSDVLRMLSEIWRQGRTPTPRRGTFPVATPAIVYPRQGNADAAATWIGHSTVLLQLGALNVLTDPVFCQRAFPVQWLGPRRVMDPAVSLDELPPLDVVLLSHNHYDHLDRSAVRQIARAHPSATWVVPLKLGAYLRRWGAREIVELDWWQEASLGSLGVTATPARHMSARRLGDRNRTLWCGYAVEAAGLRVFFAGDTAYHPDFGEVGARCGPFDFVMIPIGAYEPRWFMQRVHVNPEEAVRIYTDLVAVHARARAPLMLAIHWGTFRLTAEAMDEPPRRAAARWPEVGLEADRLWVARFGETRRLVP
jgi:N-acyl-phosphatidylethanolamine-hydrolysing phospholipase D